MYLCTLFSETWVSVSDLYQNSAYLVLPRRAWVASRLWTSSVLTSQDHSLRLLLRPGLNRAKTYKEEKKMEMSKNIHSPSKCLAWVKKCCHIWLDQNFEPSLLTRDPRGDVCIQFFIKRKWRFGPGRILGSTLCTAKWQHFVSDS